MRAALVVLVLLLAGCTTGPFAPDGSDEPPRPRNAIVVSSNPLAAEAGAQMLRAGGNAVDAAAAVAFALTVVEPHFSGIGGGAFLLYRAADGTAIVLDGRETAPAASTPDQFLLPGGVPMPFERAHTRGTAVGVPGATKLWEQALTESGTMSLAQVLAPAIAYAEDGFEVDAYLARYLADPVIAQKMHAWPASARLFYPGAVCPPPTPLEGEIPCVGGEAPQEGDLFAQPELAATLRLLAAQGSDAFYRGEIADAIVATQATREGRMTAADLESYRVERREPLRIGYHGDEVLSMPPPGGGLVVLQMLGILEPLGIAEGGHNSGATLHTVIEAMHLSYADRAAYLGDPAFVDVPVEALLSPAYLEERRALIGERANADVAPGDPGNGTREADDSDIATASHTSAFLVVDREGNVASATATIESIFGSGMVVPGYGFLLNNELTDFNVEPGGANEVQPGKRPRSAMSPSIVLRDGAPYMVAGASGGPTIITSVLQVLQNALDHGLDIEGAVSAGRVYSPAHGEMPFDVRWDRDVPEEARADLRERGHAPELASSGTISQAEAALLVDGAWTGAADSRAAAGGVVVVGP